MIFEGVIEQDGFSSGYYDHAKSESKPQALAVEIIAYMGKAKGKEEEILRRGKAVMEWIQTITKEDSALPGKIVDELQKMEAGKTVAALIRSSVIEAQ